MATHSSIHTWRIPRTEGLVGYSPWGHGVGHDGVTHTHTHTHTHTIITFRYLYSLGFILCSVLGCFLISFSFSWLKESSRCPPEWLLPIYIPSIGGGGFPCLYTLSALIVCRVFGNGHSYQCDVITHCILELHFSNI